MFSYIYYRVYSFYENRDSMPRLYGLLILSMIQSLSVFNISIITELLFGSDLLFFINSKIVVGGMFFTALVVNTMFFKEESINEYKLKWGEDIRNKRILKGFLVLALILFSVGFPMLIGGLRHNLGLDI